MKIACWIAAAYLIGSIPFGLIIGKVLFGVNIREHGSRNLGATNAARVLGKGRKTATVAFFAIVTLLDASKGYLVVFAASAMRPPAGFVDGSFAGVPAGVFAAVGAIAGHMASVYLKFKGGKGVAASAGAMAALAPLPTAIAAAAWIAAVAATRYVSIGSMLAAVSLPVAAAALGSPWQLTAFLAAMAALIIFRHRTNIARLARGAENRVGGKKMEDRDDD